MTESQDLRDARAELTASIARSTIRISENTPGVGTSLILHAAKLAKRPGSLSVLHVEDDAMMTKYIAVDTKKTFPAVDWARVEFTPAHDLATAAIYLSGNHKFDCILLDLGLPDSSGLETIDKVRAIDSNTPIVVATGFTVSTAIIKARGASCVLVKPGLTAHSVFTALSQAVLDGAK